MSTGACTEANSTAQCQQYSARLPPAVQVHHVEMLLQIHLPEITAAAIQGPWFSAGLTSGSCHCSGGMQAGRQPHAQTCHGVRASSQFPGPRQTDTQTQTDRLLGMQAMRQRRQAYSSGIDRYGVAHQPAFKIAPVNGSLTVPVHVLQPGTAAQHGSQPATSFTLLLIILTLLLRQLCFLIAHSSLRLAATTACRQAARAMPMQRTPGCCSDAPATRPCLLQCHTLLSAALGQI